jgi:hypothetical protein
MAIITFLRVPILLFMLLFLKALACAVSELH